MNDAAVERVTDDLELYAPFNGGDRGDYNGPPPEYRDFEEQVAAFELELENALQNESGSQKDYDQAENENASVQQQDESTEKDDEQNPDQGMAQSQVELISHLTQDSSAGAQAKFENISQQDGELKKYIDMIEQFLISESDAGHGAEARITLNDQFIDGAQVRIVNEKDAVQLEWTAKTTESYRLLMREKEQLEQQLEQRLSKTVTINIVDDF